MVHAGEYSEPVSYTARSDGNLRLADGLREIDSTEEDVTDYDAVGLLRPASSAVKV